MSAQISNQTPEKGAWSALREVPSNVWSSVFRNPLPSTDLERASTSFTNFFLHIHPVKVHKNTLRPIYTLGLGLISLFLFFSLLCSGILLMFYCTASREASRARAAMMIRPTIFPAAVMLVFSQPSRAGRRMLS